MQGSPFRPLRRAWRSALGSLLIASVTLLLCACGGAGARESSASPWSQTAPPLVVAHRGGTGDAPENTLDAIEKALANRADSMWLSVQLSKDAVPMLYRPADLATLTNASGPLSDRTAAELARVNAGWSFKSTDGRYPYRDSPVGIPTLRDALRALPPGMTVMLDMKAPPPAEPLAGAVARVLTEENAWSRVMLYSTEAAHTQAFSAYAQAQLFESRDATRGRLLGTLLNETCDNAPATPSWAAFELQRKLVVVEKFTLGEGTSSVNTTLWTPETVNCFRQKARVKILAIAVNDAQDYRTAACLGIDAVLADSPSQMAAIRGEMSSRPLYCPARAAPVDGTNGR